MLLRTRSAAVRQPMMAPGEQGGWRVRVPGELRCCGGGLVQVGMTRGHGQFRARLTAPPAIGLCTLKLDVSHLSPCYCVISPTPHRQPLPRREIAEHRPAYLRSSNHTCAQRLCRHTSATPKARNDALRLRIDSALQLRTSRAIIHRLCHTCFTPRPPYI